MRTDVSLGAGLMARGRALTCLLIGAVGCSGGDGLPRQAVHGTVSYAGKPVETGMIQFLPTNTNTPDAVQGGAPIVKGRYQIERYEGLVPGTYRVTIHATQAPKPSVASEPPGQMANLPAELIPPKYNIDSTLSVEIKPQQSEPIDFNLAR